MSYRFHGQTLTVRQWALAWGVSFADARMRLRQAARFGDAEAVEKWRMAKESNP